ncbi:MAG: zinc ribbon domain-containing protein [Lachnospiraceae bacterium]|nr:zinc ribbon domain-containing protein [Lachnospiraceae bacterium]
MSDYVFCPRCGAVTKPGVCSNCGYNLNKDIEIDSGNTENTENMESGIESGKSEPFLNDIVKKTDPNKGSKGWLIGLFLGLGLIAFLIVFGILIVLICIFPAVLKIFFTANQINSTINGFNNSSTTNNNNPATPDINLPGIDPDANPTDPDNGLQEKEYYYAQTIEGAYSGTSRFDYDKFKDEYGDKANEFWDQPAEDTFDYFLNGNFSSYLRFGSSHEFIPRDAYPTPYLDYVRDSYIATGNYDIQRHIVRYEATVDGIFVNAYCAYYSIESDKVDFTDVNEKLRDQALSELYDFLTNQKSSGVYNYTLYCDAVVTFNNDEILSVIYDVCSYEDNNTANFNLHGMNVDVKNGAVLDNTKILNFDDDFSKFFTQRSNIQNSYVDAINNSSVSDLTKVFNDDDALILFFTPLGIEVGINYRYLDTFGWVTITLNDFDAYYSGNYNFNIDFGKGYDMYQYEKDNNINSGDFDYDDGNVFDL